MPYRHTQPGTWIVVPILGFAVLDAVIAWWTGQWMPVVVLVVLVAVAIVFSSLTVEVNEGELRWYFGPGFWSYRLPLGGYRDGDDGAEPLVVRLGHQEGAGLPAL